jgi:hypothetical protein
VLELRDATLLVPSLKKVAAVAAAIPSVEAFVAQVSHMKSAAAAAAAQLGPRSACICAAARSCSAARAAAGQSSHGLLDDTAEAARAVCLCDCLCHRKCCCCSVPTTSCIAAAAAAPRCVRWCCVRVWPSHLQRCRTPVSGRNVFLRWGRPEYHLPSAGLPTGLCLLWTHVDGEN